MDHLRSQRSRFRTTIVPVGGDQGDRQGPSRCLVLLGQIALDLVEKQPRWPERTADQLRIPGEVDEAEHQRRDADIEECLGDLVVGRLEREARVRVTRHSSPFGARSRDLGVI